MGPERSKAGVHRCPQWPPAFSPTGVPAFRQHPGVGFSPKCELPGHRLAVDLARPAITSTSRLVHTVASAILPRPAHREQPGTSGRVILAGSVVGGRLLGRGGPAG